MKKIRVAGVLTMALFLIGCGAQGDTPMEGDRVKQETSTDPWRPLARYIGDRISEFDAIPEDRKRELTSMADFVTASLDTGTTARLTFICTHNSRRSHLGQVWAQVAAHHFGLDSLVQTYSGGTEVTAFNGRAVGTLRRAGLDIHPAVIDDNPHYAVHYAEGEAPMICFSKRYDDAGQNPVGGFAAVMTCDNADRACPVVYGSSARFSIPYEDPKVSDGTAEEKDTYDARCAQIAREMLFVMSLASS